MGVGREGRISKNKKHWSHFFFLPYLKLMIRQKRTSIVKQGQGGKYLSEYLICKLSEPIT